MKIHSISKFTQAYAFALSLIALLTLAIFITMHQVILTQEGGARLVNLSGSQRWQSQKTALLSVELIHATNLSEQNLFRTQLQDLVKKMKTTDLELTRGDPTSLIYLSSQIKKMYYTSPINLEYQITRYTSEALALSKDPSDLLTPDNPHLVYILKSNDSLLLSLNQIVNLYQLESERKLKTLQTLETTSGLIILIALFFLAVSIFRPLANTLRSERAQLEQVNRELRYLSSVDGLTGIANRRQFDQFISHLWSLSIRQTELIALIMCDIDFFKAYNDHYGHLQGDECLKKVAAALKESIKRPGDLVARYGGEEFVVVLPKTDRLGAEKVAETLRASVENLQLSHHSSSVKPYVTISLGVAIAEARPDSDALKLIKSADEALYQAKQNGRNCWIVGQT